MNKKNKKVIVISGKQFSGKDTVANVLKIKMPGFRLAPLADAIKIEFSEDKKLTFNEVERNKPLYRAELILHGNKRRAQDPNYWINKVLDTEGDIIVSDVRLRYEIISFDKFDAVKIRIESSREEREKRGHLVKENDATEIDLDEYENWDYVIENNGSIKELQENAAKVAESILKDFSIQPV